LAHRGARGTVSVRVASGQQAVLIAGRKTSISVL
jgi:hypothetical protein